ncbi:MAG: hypothetical protein HFE74_04445 [Firmicutes bacterium]|jgi:hypothetical protein|nr:hypothetical protein [Bacillota bacterium]
MATILSNKKSTYGSPYAFYTVDVTISERKETTAKVTFKVTAHLQYSESKTQYGMTCGLYIGGSWHDVTLVPKGTWWSGTGNKTASSTFTISGLTASQTSITGIQFRATSSDRSGTLTATGCSSVSIATYFLASTPSASNVTTGSSVTIYTNRNSSSLTHTVSLSVGGTKRVEWTGVGASKAYTIPRSWASYITNAANATCTITCTTYNGSSQIGSAKTSTFTITVNSADIPTISGVSVVPQNTNSVVNGWGIYLQGYSKAKIQVTGASGVYGSSIKSYKVVYNGSTSTTHPYTTPVFDSAGTKSATVYAIDSRGRSSSGYTINWGVVSYAKPTLSSVSTYRSLSDGTKDDSGTYIAVKGAASCSDCSKNNSVSLRCRYKTKTGSYGEYIDIVANTLSVIGDGNVLVTTSYIVEVSAIDSLGSVATIQLSIPTKKVALNFMDEVKGAGIGKYAEKENVLQVGFSTEIEGAVTASANGQFNNILLNAHGVIAQIGPQSSNYMYFVCAVPFYFNNEVQIRGALNPYTNETYDMGTKSKRWKYVYAKGLSAANGDGVWLTDTTGKEYKSLYVATDDGSYFQGPGTMYFRSNLNSSSYQGHWLRLFREQSGSYRTIFRPNVNSTAYLGTTSERWNTAFFTNAITASDLKEKDVIEDFDFKAEEFILGLKPIAYRRKGEGDGGKRIHLGFGAQDVAKTIDDLEMGNLSMVQASVVEEGSVERENDNGKVETVIERVEKPYDGGSVDDSKLSWGLNYNELIAPMVLMIQKQEERIKKLEEYIAKLGNHVDKTEEV